MKRVISIAVSLVILGFIYWNIDLAEFPVLIRGCNLFWLTCGCLMFLPTILFPAIRLRLIAPEGSGVTVREAVRLILAASSLNIVLPSKLGEIVKGYFIAEKGTISLPTALSLVIYEKACDILSLLLWCAFGLVFYARGNIGFVPLSILVWIGLLAGSLILFSRSFSLFFFRIALALVPGVIGRKIILLKESWLEMQEYLVNRRGLMMKTAVLSIAVWFAHLLQIWFFALALGGSIPLAAHLGLTPLAIFTGLIPVTFAGIGTRDAALIFFLKGYLGVTVSAALGVFCTLRYIVPALAGLPYLSRYISLIRNSENDIAG